LVNSTLHYSQIIPIDITIENTGTAYLIKWRNTGLPGRSRAMTFAYYFSRQLALNFNNPFGRSARFLFRPLKNSLDYFSIN
jgi:hypothetical protein